MRNIFCYRNLNAVFNMYLIRNTSDHDTTTVITTSDHIYKYDNHIYIGENIYKCDNIYKCNL